MKQKRPKSTLLADSTRRLITTKQTKPRLVASAAASYQRRGVMVWTSKYSLLHTNKRVYCHTPPPPPPNRRCYQADTPLPRCTPGKCHYYQLPNMVSYDKWLNMVVTCLIWKVIRHIPYKSRYRQQATHHLPRTWHLLGTPDGVKWKFIRHVYDILFLLSPPRHI